MKGIKLPMLDGDGSPLEEMLIENEKAKIIQKKQRSKDEVQRAKAESRKGKGRR